MPGWQEVEVRPVADEQGVLANQLEARVQQLASEWAKGKTNLKDILGINDKELYTIATQGYRLFLQGKADRARIYFEGLVAMDPRNPYYYRALGSIYWRLKAPDKAIKQFSYAIKVSPQDIASFIGRAEVYVSTRQNELARRDLEQAIAIGSAADAPLVRKAKAIMRMLPA